MLQHGPGVAFYADDFTGAMDALLQLRRCGLDGVLLLRADEETLARHSQHAVVGIAGVARSLPVSELETEIRPVLQRLWELQPRVLQYKACSTVDSSPTVGSLGRVSEILRQVTGQQDIPALFAQPDFGRYTLFGHHFAADGGVVHRLDRHPTMSTHPSTPIDEADLTLFLGRQTISPVRSLPLTRYASAQPTGDPVLTVLDAVTDEHLAEVGRMLLAPGRPMTAIGSGGLSRAVGLQLGDAAASLPRWSPSAPVLVLSGSQSPQTARQIDATHSAGWPVRALQSVDLAAGAEAAGWVHSALASNGRAVVHSGELGSAPGLLQALADRYTSLLASAQASHPGLTVVSCGGDTSSRLVRNLGPTSLQLAGVLGQNVVISRLEVPGHWADGTRILLKGGQVGPTDLFLQVAGDVSAPPTEPN